MNKSNKSERRKVQQPSCPPKYQPLPPENSPPIPHKHRPPLPPKKRSSCSPNHTPTPSKHSSGHILTPNSSYSNYGGLQKKFP